MADNISGRSCQSQRDVAYRISDSHRCVYEKNIGGGILKTDFNFRVTNACDDVLWSMPSESWRNQDDEAKGLLEWIAMPWTFEEIEREWFGDAHLAWDQEDVVRAFDLAERIRGRDWVLGDEVAAAVVAAFPGVGRRGGYQESLRVYWFGKRAASIVGAQGAEEFIQRLIANDPSKSEEASAIHLLRAKNPDTELEILLNRDPTVLEVEQIIAEAEIACREAQGHQRDIVDVASILVKAATRKSLSHR